MDHRGPGRPTSSVAATVGLAVLLLAAGALVLVRSADRRKPSPPPAPALTSPAPTVDAPEVRRGWRQENMLAAGLSTPRGLAVGPGGELWVVGDQAVVALRPGEAPRVLTSLDAEPTCAAPDGQGGLLVAMRDGVRLLDSQGREVIRWKVEGRRAWVSGVAAAGETVWVADAGDRVVLRYDRQGQLLGRLGEKDTATGAPGLLAPSPHLDVVPDAEGVWVTNPGRRQVERYVTADAGRTWKLAAAWGKAGVDLERFCGCCNPTDLARLPDGKLVTSEKGLPRVKVYTPQGVLESVVALPEDLSRDVAGLDLATDSQGRIYVLDPRARAVRVFARMP